MPTNSKIQIVILATVLLIKIKMCTFIFEAGNQLCFLKENKCVFERGEPFTSWLFSLLFFHLPCFGFLQAFYENFHQVHAKNNNICQGLNIHCKQVEIIISLR